MSEQDASYPASQTSKAGRTVPSSTMSWRLRPRDMGGILDQAFRLYRANFLPFLAVTAIVHVPAQLLFYATVFRVPRSLVGLSVPGIFLQSDLYSVLLYPGYAALVTIIVD